MGTFSASLTCRREELPYNVLELSVAINPPTEPFLPIKNRNEVEVVFMDRQWDELASKYVDHQMQ